jgi:hypothetical protein
MSGYSGTPLPRKLGVKPGHRVLLYGAPSGFELDGAVSGAGAFDVILAFCPDLATLERGFGGWRARLDPAGGLWVAWPKKASKVPTDLTENIVREFGLATGLVDNKVCAIDEIWSGLRFVVRLADRP